MCSIIVITENNFAPCSVCGTYHSICGTNPWLRSHDLTKKGKMHTKAMSHCFTKDAKTLYCTVLVFASSSTLKNFVLQLVSQQIYCYPTHAMQKAGLSDCFLSVCLSYRFMIISVYRGTIYKFNVIF